MALRRITHHSLAFCAFGPGGFARDDLLFRFHLKCCQSLGHSSRLYRIMKKGFKEKNRSIEVWRVLSVWVFQAAVVPVLSLSVTLEVAGVTSKHCPGVSEHSPLPAELHRLQGSSNFTA